MNIQMRIIKTKTYEEMSAIAAGIIGGQVLLKPNCVLGLATGWASKRLPERQLSASIVK